MGSSSNSAKGLMLVMSHMLLFLFGACDDAHANQQRLVAHEVDALKDISKELGKKDWNFNVDPCSNDTSWNSPMRIDMPTYVNQIICSYWGDACHVVNMSIENNRFSGTVPAQLGKLVNLQSLTLSSNYLTGQLPKELANLTNLTELRITDNNFSGEIPDYFQNWKKLQKLQIQGSGFEGSIPSSISILNELTELRISDLVGENSVFPSLKNMENLKYLILRNCNISGTIPSTIGGMNGLKTLDLSFNKLHGNIPSELKILDLNHMYLTSNFLSGPIPGWIKTRGDTDIDLSYNKFDEDSAPTSCNQPNLNLYRSTSRMTTSSFYKNTSRITTSTMPMCLRDSCSKGGLGD